MQTLLTIAGFDPSSGAGVTADLAVFAAHGFFGTACITALTVQTTTGVSGVYPTDPQTVIETLNALQLDLPPDGIKIGMLASEDNVAVVSDFLSRLREGGKKVPIVLDPVLQSSSGASLLTHAGLRILQERLLPLVDWMTPNLPELGILIGKRVGCPAEMESGCRDLMAKYPGLSLVATGGHLDSSSDLVALADGTLGWIHGEKLQSRATHGTGCAFSSSLVCDLVAGMGGLEAAKRAKSYVAEAIRTAKPIGHGFGPINLLWPLVEEGKKAKEEATTPKFTSA